MLYKIKPHLFNSFIANTDKLIKYELEKYKAQQKEMKSLRLVFC